MTLVDENKRDAVVRELKRRGLRVTKQRIAIAETIFSEEGHHSVEELYRRVKERLPQLGYATIYRTVRLLQQCGFITTHHFDTGQTRFDTDPNDHDHLICLECDRIVEFASPEIGVLQDEIAKQFGFRIVKRKHELYAHCSLYLTRGRCEHKKD